MANIPSGLGSLRSIKERSKKAFEQSAQWEDVLSDSYEYFLPQRNLFNRDGKGQKKTDRIFDSTSAAAIKIGASKIQENMAPIWSKWAKFDISNESQRAMDEQGDESKTEVQEALEEEASILFDVINRSNFGTQFYEFALDLLIGTATMQIEEDDSDEMPIIFSSVPQVGIAFEEGPHGAVENHYRKFKVKARNIERKWPGFEVSSSLSTVIQDSPDCDVQLIQAVLFDPKEKIYYALVWVESEEKASWVESFDQSSPIITTRYSKTAGEVRGRGPALDVLSDVKTLNKAKEFALRKSAIDLSGIWTGTDDGVTNPYNMTVAPGVVIPVGSNNTSNPSLARLDTNTNLELGLFVINDLQNAIKTALFNDLRDPDDSVVSATQFAMESRALAKRIGSAAGRIQTEALIPILRRVHYILKRRGMVKPIVIGGREITIKFTSPLARTQDAEELLSVQQAVAFTIESAGPDQAKMAFKLEDFGTWAAGKTGMPQELVRTQSEKAQIIQAGAEAAKQEMQQGQPQQPQQPNLEVVQ